MLIPTSAHGTNPATAQMIGFKNQINPCLDNGNIDTDKIKSVLEDIGSSCAGLMITYPSTHGVYEEDIIDICKLVHDHGGMVYMDGANMNAQVGLTNPGHIGADVCHLNLQKRHILDGGGGLAWGQFAVMMH